MQRITLELFVGDEVDVIATAERLRDTLGEDLLSAEDGVIHGFGILTENEVTAQRVADYVGMDEIDNIDDGWKAFLELIADRFQ